MDRAGNSSLLALALVLLAVPCLHAEPTDDEKKSLKAANQSYKDGAFELTNDRVNGLLKKYPKSELTAEAELLQAQALYQLGRNDDAVAALNTPLDQVPEKFRSDYLFWQAESLVGLSKWPEAEQKYRALLALQPPSGHIDAANLGLAWSLFKQGKEADALTLIQGLIKAKPGDPAAQQAQLMLAKINLAKRQLPEAIAALNALLATKPGHGLTYEANYWLGEACTANNQPDLAVAAYRKITDDPQAFPKPLVAQAFLGLGRAEHALKQDDQAMLAYEQTYKLTQDETTRLDAFRAYLDSARAGGQLPEAVAKLQDFAKTSVKSAPAALFAIGSALAGAGEDDKAIGILESLLVAYGTSPWVPSANYQLGLLYARTGKPDQAIKAFQNCIAATKDPVVIRSARFHLGVVLQQVKDYAGAAAQFAQVSDGTDADAEDASYNFLRTQAYLGKADVFAKSLADFNKRFPKSGHIREIALVQGQLLTNLNKAEDAKAVYQKALALGGNDATQLAILRNLADLQYQTSDLEGTLATCKTIMEKFPNDALAAAQRSVLVSYELKKMNEDEVEKAFIDLAQKYKDVPGAPEAYFRLGEFYSYRQDYVKAQDAFQQLTVNYPTSSYVDSAYFFAGRAALAHQDYAAALTLLGKVTDGSPFKPNARLWEGRVHQERVQADQGNFTQAIPLYNAVLATEKTGPLFVDANLLKGECLFELGAKNPDSYNQAMSCFDQILNSKEGDIAQRNEAAVRKAKCLDKIGQTDRAIGLYLDVLYGRTAGDDSTAPNPPEFSWQIEGGWQAARIREAQKDWRGAIEVYKRLEQIGGPHQQEFHDLINKLRRDNYIYE